MNQLTLPKRAPGRKSEAVLAAEEVEDLRLCEWLEEHRARSGFAFGTRGWGYVAEGARIINKNQLDAFETWLVRVREDGLIDPDVVADDDSRRAENIEALDDPDPAAYAAEVRDRARTWLDLYQPVSAWEMVDTYIEVLVEKVDLKILFADVCEAYGVVLINGKGSSDLNLRRRMLQRFRVHHEAGRRCVLLYCGDLDPFGRLIANVLKSNLLKIAKVRDVRWDASPVQVERFGLDADQITALGLPWINNLITGSGKNLADPKHPDFNKPYVQNYIATHGVRKVEANALAARPVEAQALIEAAINRYLPRDWPRRRGEWLAPHRTAARRAFDDLIAGEAR